MKNVKMQLIILIVTFFTLTTAFGQGVISGIVLDKNKEPLPGANIILISSVKSDKLVGTTTDRDGYFLLTSVPTGSQSLNVTYIGFKDKIIDVEVQDGITNNIEVILERTILTVPEIVVTSQRREQSLMEVPIAVTAFSAVAIRKNNITAVEDYFSRTPNIYITEGASRQASNVTTSSHNLSIRGISNIGGNASSFGIYVDDINVALVTRNPHIVDMERIEVLRGPQGTFFGRNASAGVVSLVTKKPTNKTESNISVEYGRFNSLQLNGMINIPVIKDKFAIRAAGLVSGSDGNLINDHSAGDGNGYSYQHLRVSGRATPSEALTIDVSMTYSNEEQDDFGLVHTGVLSDFVKSICFPPVNCPADGDLGFYPENTTRYSHNEPLEIKDTHGIAVGRIEYDADAFVFTSLTGYTEGTFWRAGELDFASTDFLTEDNNDHIRSSFSQEFRLQSNNDSPMQWIVGGIYAKDEEDEREDINFGAQNGFGLPDGFGIEIGDYQQSIETTAAFAEVNWQTTDALTLIFGGRYSDDTVVRAETQSEFGSPLVAVNGENSFKDFSPRFAINYATSEDVSVYATVSKGWKSGGFTLDPQRQRADFGDETLWNYEAGIKAETMDRRLRLNMSVFNIDWKDVQVSAGLFGMDNDGNITAYSGVSNAASASSKGLEIEMLALVSKNTEFGMNFGYNDAKFVSFEDAVTNAGTMDLSGKPLPRAPKITLSAHSLYDVKLNDNLNGFVRAEYQYVSQSYSRLNNLAQVLTTRSLHYPFEIPGHSNWNLRIGAENEKYRIVAYTENALNSKYYTSTYDFGYVNGAGVLPSYRNFGVRVTAKLK